MFIVSIYMCASVGVRQHSESPVFTLSIHGLCICHYILVYLQTQLRARVSIEKVLSARTTEDHKNVCRQKFECGFSIAKFFFSPQT